MSIVVPADFIGEQNIPNTDETPVLNKVQWFIDEYEPQLLEHLFGSVLYADYLAGINEDPILQKWTDLASQAKRSIVCYVYYYFVSNENSFVTGNNTVSKAKNENSINVPSWDKLMKSWNTMVDRNYKVREYIGKNDYETNFTDLPQYAWEIWHVNSCRPDIFVYKNTLNV